jgi:three-Cys-motif partner protein
MADPRLDEVGVWTEIKLAILRDYLPAYSPILRKQDRIKEFAYIDGFAGPGTHISKTTGEEIEGSPTIALSLPFDQFHFVDLDGTCAELLRQKAAGKNNVTVHEGDCNEVLLREVFPRYRYDDYRRAVCLLDPYELNPNWEVVQTAGRMRSIEIFLNFMIMDANRNVLWADPDRVRHDQVVRMNAFWGDESWREAAYRTTPGLFEDMSEKARNDAIVGAYQRRLREVAGFKHVPDPFPMRNSKGAVVYYLLFASQNETGASIVKDIFRKYRYKGVPDGRKIQD